MVRVVQVSAHYPPNFVSGGTLVPQRLARGLAARGHDVAVYAGYLDPNREPLSTWTQDDGFGVQVRWVVTTPWTGWADRRNFDNPAVADDFAGWLDEQRPDVVHLHSLQTLGGDLVRVARASGARVVLTMHDFWWTCARQFLVAPDGRPCSLVVPCGGCPCQLSHDWLVERDAWLAARAEEADLVVAPSQTAARVLIANGVDPARLRVDENGVPQGEPSAAKDVERPRSPLRLLYAGGEDPMKGFEVLVAAIDRLRTTHEWTLDLYNVTTALENPRCSTHPAFSPDELGQVLASHDVLVLPSLMRESHSILTREALAAGLPVICTDSLGPEEVVVDGVNGRVVAAADPTALARAIGALVDHPEQVAVMAEKAGHVVVRTVEEQVSSTEELYHEVLAAQAPGLPPIAPERVLFIVGIAGAPLRYRAQLPAEALAMAGVETRVLHYRDPDLPAGVAWADAVVVYRVPATTQVLDLIAGLRATRPLVPVLFDVDDLIVDPDLRGELRGLDGLSQAEERMWWHGVARYRTMLEVADGFVGSTNRLCRAVAELTGLPTYRYPNGVGTVLGRLSQRAADADRHPGPLRIGYFSGTTTHDADWAMVEPVVARLLTERPELQLWIGGHLTLGASLTPFGERVRRFAMVDWTRLPERLRQLDVNLAPLAGHSAFNEAKSAIKWLEAALVRTPTVASPTEPFAEAVDDGATGLLAEGEDQWYDALCRLLDDVELRERMGARAQRAALLTWSPPAQGRRYRELLTQAVVLRATVPERISTWQPVADDEPFDLACVVEPYPPRSVRTTAGRWRGRWATVVRVLRHRGVVGLVRAVAGRLVAVVRR